MRINWFKRSDDPNDMLCVWERFAYACSNTGSAFGYILIAGFLTFYYTNVVGLDPGKVGTILLASRFFDGFSDLLMGIIIDKTDTKMGKARPWVLIGSIPHAIALVLAFSVPMNASTTMQYVFVFATYNLVNTVTYTILSTSFFTQNCLNTSNSEERMKSGIWFQVGANAVIFLVNATCIKWVNAMGGGVGAWRMAVTVFAVIGSAMMMFSALCTRERVTPSPEDAQRPLKERLGAVFTDKNWLIYVSSSTIANIGYMLISGGCLYYCQDVLGNVERQATLSSLQSGLSFVVLMLLMAPIIKKIGNVAARQLSFICFIIACGGMLLLTNWTFVIIMYAFVGLGWAFILGSQGALIADVSQHIGEKVGFDVSGISNAGNTFISKVGVGLSSGLLGWVLSAFGYDGTATVQTERAILGVKVAVLVLPIFAMVVGLLMMTQFDLYKKGYIKEAGRN